jgi:hypothetical protein
MVDEAQTRKGRGLGKTPALVATSIRLPKYLLDYFTEAHGNKKQKVMRDILMQYVDSKLKGEVNG